MSSYTTDTESEEEETSVKSKAKRAVSTVRDRSPAGALTMLAGGVLTARAFRMKRKKLAALQGLIGVTLLALGIRQQLNKRSDRVETGDDARRDDEGEKVSSDAAHTERAHDLGGGRVADETKGVYQSETEPNPRGMSDRSDIGDEGSEERDIEFVDGKEPETHQEPHLDDEDAVDPRHDDDETDETTQVDVSESAMADEVNEAAGPSSEQAYPASEGTDPEPSAEKAADQETDVDEARNADDDKSDDDTDEDIDPIS
jgi:hypothetical protein